MIFGTSGQRRRRLPHGVILMMLKYIIQSTDINEYRQKNDYKHAIRTIGPELKDALRETLIPVEGLATDLIVENGSRKKRLPRDVVSEIISFVEFDAIRERRFRYMVERVKQYLRCSRDSKVIFVGQVMGMEIQLTMKNDTNEKSCYVYYGGPKTVIPGAFTPSVYQYKHPRHYLQINFDYIEPTEFNYRFFEELESVMRWQPDCFHVILEERPIPHFPVSDFKNPSDNLERVVRFCQMFWSQDELETVDLFQIIDGLDYKTSIGGYNTGNYCIMITRVEYKPNSKIMNSMSYTRINDNIHKMEDFYYDLIYELLNEYDAGNYEWVPNDEKNKNW